MKKTKKVIFEDLNKIEADVLKEKYENKGYKVKVIVSEYFYATGFITHTIKSYKLKAKKVYEDVG